MTNQCSNERTDLIRHSSSEIRPFASGARSISWGIFLAISWTWCIGMFLPVILLRDFGWAGFWVFAIPNCLGAAAMGWVLRSPDSSRELVRRHEAACVAFSFVTIAFHAFFAAWLIRDLCGSPTGLYLAAAFVAFWLMMQWRGSGKFLAAGLALVISLAVIAWGIRRGDLPYVAEPIPHSPFSLPRIDALWLAPVCAFGFLLCPYLDLTFHAARQGTEGYESPAAFTIGFCVIFPVMLLCTIAYSGRLVAGLDPVIYPQLAIILSIHFIVQSGFTVAAHARQLAARVSRISMRTFMLFALAIIAAVFLGILSQNRQYHALSAGEVIYRAFLGFYGLVFPAYVWLAVVRPQKSMRRVLFAVAAAMPLFWLGFIEQRMIWLVPGVLIPILSKWSFMPRRPAPASAVPPARAAETGR